MMKVSGKTKVQNSSDCEPVFSLVPNKSHILQVLLHCEHLHKNLYFLVSHSSGYYFHGDGDVFHFWFYKR